MTVTKGVTVYFTSPATPLLPRRREPVAQDTAQRYYVGSSLTAEYGVRSSLARSATAAKPNQTP